MNDQKPSAPAPEPFYSAENYAPEESVGNLMRLILAGLKGQVGQALEPEGVTSAQWLPLLLLFRCRAHTGAELARECHMDAGAMTRLLDRLEAKGLCRRERDPADRRVVQLVLTDEGLRAAAAVPRVLSQVQNQALTGFSHDEWQTLKNLLRRVLDNVQAATAGGTHDETCY